MGDMNPLESYCTGKQRFDTRALAASISQRKSKARERGPMTPYRCPACRGWHLSSRKRGL